MDEQFRTIYTKYTRHNSDTKNTLCDILSYLGNSYKDDLFTISLTGSGAISASKYLDIPFIQEVISCKKGVQEYFPETDVVIELGGEDAKIIYFDKFIEQRMNGTCARWNWGVYRPNGIIIKHRCRRFKQSSKRLRNGISYCITLPEYLLKQMYNL